MNAIASHLASIIGTDAVYSWDSLPLSQQHLIQPALTPGKTPSCVVYPRTQTQLAEVITNANNHKWRVLPCGSGTKLHWGGLAENIDVVVSTEKINQLIEHAVGDLTITVEAGMRFSQIQEILGTAKQAIALDPYSPKSATIGGIVATADTGSLRQRYGSVRDQLLGITFVRADGQIAKAGGRVVKNVAGYDLMKLFTGSHGTLGIISQVTFRVYPLPETSATVVLTGNIEAISQAATILKSSALTPTQADLISSKLVSQLNLGQGMGLITRFQSINESVKEQSNRLLEIGKKLGLHNEIYAADNEAHLWQRLPEIIHDSTPNTAITCKIGVLPTAATQVLTEIETGVIHLSSGLGLVRLENQNQVLALRQLCQSHYGFLTVLSAPTTIKSQIDIWGYTGNALDVIHRIKKQFDNNYILSPGRFVNGI
ncbi:MAG TPA: FAD-binding oxidoreductase [Nostocaceae cyanobacterium]|nr:FAD-binding oxidoreductase [Nostocaceae cyanobacterium]